ncbi:NAD-dependent alcohol dehydrogenase, partial [Halobacterium salinarum]|nr:NAD-dependent alcohol dehydrogenase [Halobacterium salinarum]
TAVRDALGLPARLRDTDGPARSELQAVAAAAVADPFVDNAPDGVPLTRADATEILDAAW